MGLQLKKRATGRIPDAGAQINGEPLSIEWAKSAWAKSPAHFPKICGDLADDFAHAALRALAKFLDGSSRRNPTRQCRVIAAVEIAPAGHWR
jgi:hypothetical protein